MAKQPIVFAMANPDPEITPEAVKAVRSDAIIATGRSDYPNQVNNVLGFPYIFRGALDVRATTINDAMKIAAAYAIAALAREDVPDEVSAAYRGRRLRYGPELPDPDAVRSAPDHRGAVGGRQGGDGERRRAQADRRCRALPRHAARPARSDREPHAADHRPGARPSQAHGVRRGRGGEDDPRRLAWRNLGLGTPILIGREERIDETLRRHGPEAAGRRSRSTTPGSASATPTTPSSSTSARQRRGMLFRDCQRQVNLDRNVFGSCMVAHGDADAMVTGLTRNYTSVLRDVHKVIDPNPGERLFGLTMMVARGRTVFIADTTVHELPTSVELADIAIQTAHSARRMGFTPRVAFLSFSTFGNRRVERAMRIQDAVAELDRRAGRLRVRRRDVGRRRARPRAAGALPVLPPVGAGQRADHAGAAQRQHQLACCSSSWAAAR